MDARNEPRDWRAAARAAGRVAVALAVVPLACVWTDTILRASKSAAEVVLTPDELRSLTAGQGSVQAGRPPTVEEPNQQPSAATGEQQNGEENPSAEQVSTATGEDVAQTAEPDPEEELRKAPEPEATGDEATGQAEAAADAQPPPALPISSGAEGSLASFAGPGVESGGDEPAATGSGTGPAWEVTFAASPTPESLSRLPQTRLAACRARRGYTELVLVERGELSRPVTVDDFLRLEPAYQGRQGIVLSPEMLQPWQDRLLVYGGGWQAWLLVEDQLFARWLDEVRQSLASRRAVWDQVARIAAQLQPDGRMVLQEVELRPATPPADENMPVSGEQ